MDKGAIRILIYKYSQLINESSNVFQVERQKIHIVTDLLNNPCRQISQKAESGKYTGCSNTTELCCHQNSNSRSALWILRQVVGILM